MALAEGQASYRNFLHSPLQPAHLPLARPFNAPRFFSPGIPAGVRSPVHGNLQQHDNSRIAEVLIDALTRRTWIKEDDLARAILLNPKQVRKALHYLEEERIVTRSHVKEKDKDREARTRMRAEEHGVDEGIIMERIRNIDKKTVSYVCLNYSRVVDALNLRIGTARAELKFKIEKGPVTVLYRCTNDPETCGRRYSSLDAMRLIDFKTGAFVCQLCQWEVVQLGGGEDGAPAEPKTKAGLQAILDKFERQIAPVQRQLARVKGATPPQYGTLNEWTKAGTRGVRGGGREWLRPFVCSSRALELKA